LDSDTNLFKSGYFDSLNVVQFIVAIEKKFKIKISKNEIKYSSFETLSGVEDLIKEKIK
jgi:acyl carrier protein